MDKNSFTYASGFAGIGGMTMGLEPLGGKGVIAWEYDPTSKTQYAQDAHKLLHPNIPIDGDICKVNTDELPDFDLFCFTPPCQAFSVAGKRGGFDDIRGTLTFEALRIAAAKQPKALFMENVKGLVNHDKGQTLSVIIRAINDVGYTVDFTVLNSKFFDVAQNRERVYLVGIRNDLIQSEPWNNTEGKTMLPKAKKRYQDEGAKTFNFDWPEQTAVRTKLRDFLEKTVDEKYYLSEDRTAKLVTQLEGKDLKVGSVASHPFSKKFEFNGFNNDTYSPAMIATDYKAPKCLLEDGLPIKEATWKGFTVATDGDAVNLQFPNSKTRRGRVGKQMANTIEASGINQGVVESVKVLDDSPNMLGHIDIKGQDIVKRVYDVDGQAPTLTTMGGGHREPKIAEEVRPVLTPDRLEKRQNGRRFKEDGEDSFTLTSIDRHGIALGNYPKYRIRKLTPVECLRLQAIPQNHIDTLTKNFSNSRLYRFAGNGLTISVVRAIGERLVKYL